jgi:hypothetical protein
LEAVNDRQALTYCNRLFPNLFLYTLDAFGTAEDSIVWVDVLCWSTSRILLAQFAEFRIFNTVNGRDRETQSVRHRQLN